MENKQNTQKHIPEAKITKLELDEIPVGIFVTDTAGKVLEVNREFCKITKRRREKIVGQKFTLSNSNNSIENSTSLKIIELATQENQILRLELKEKQIQKSGEEYKIYTVSKIDSSDLKKSENIEHFQGEKTVGVFIDLTAIITGDGIYQHISPHYSELLGYAEEELTGKSYFDFLHPGDKAKIRGELKKLKSNKQMKLSAYRHKRKQGKWCWLKSVANVSTTDKISNEIVLSSVEIDDFSLIQKEIKKDIERYNLINKTTNDVIYDWDIENDVFRWEDSFYRHFGYRKSKKEFKLSDWEKHTHPIDVEKHRQSWNVFMTDKNRERWLNVFRFKHANGSYIYVEEIGYLIRDKIGKPKRMIGVLRDVNESKQLEVQKQIQYQLENIFRKEQKLSEILDDALKFLSDFANCNIAEIWLTSLNKENLNLISTFYRDDKGKTFYRDSKEVKKMKLGEGIPGYVWQNQKVEVWDKIHLSNDFVRKDAASKSGIKYAIGIPLVYHKEFIGALLLGSKDSMSDIRYSTSLLKELGVFMGIKIKRKQEEEELYLLFHSAPDIIAVASPHGYFTKVNAAFCNLLGYSEKELTSKPFSEFIHPDDITRTEQEYEETITGERTANNFTNRYKTKSGSYKWIAWSSSDVFGEDSSVFAYGRDITEMKKLQQLAEDSVKLALVGSWEIDTIENKVFWSGITKEIYEIAGKDHPQNEFDILNFVEEDYRNTILQKIQDCKGNGTPWDEELRIITKKGRKKWVRIIGKSEFIAGKCVRIYGSVQDIDQQKKAALKLQSSLKTLEDYKFSLDQSAIIAITDHRGEIISVNKNFCAISQYSEEELIGKTHRIINSKHHPKEFFIDLWKTISSGKVWRGEVKNKAKDGTYYWVDTTIVPFLDKTGTPFQYLAIRFEITARKLAEEQIIQSHERFEKATQAANDAIWEWDIIHDKLFWGKGYETLFGYDLDSIIPSIESWKGQIHPDDREVVLASLYQVIESSEIDNWQADYRYMRSDGKYAYVDDKGIVMRNTMGKAVKMVGAMTDITYRKEHEESLKNLNEKLTKYTTELEISNRELEQFAYVASHDLQEPLRMISSFLSQLEKKYKDQLDEKAQQYIYYAVDGAKRMRQIILDLLEFSRVGKHEDKLENVDLNEIMGEILILQRKLIKDKKAKIIYKDLPILNSYRLSLLQIFQNIIGNALKYTREDIPPVIEIQAFDLGDKWKFSIEDNGMGIDEEYHQKIFVIFQRLQKDTHGGTGMGLTIVKKIVDNLGGSISLDSTTGKGTTFYITLNK
jgi:PAS domain S-box-containing protein